MVEEYTNRNIVCVKQGTERSLSFTIKAGGQPLDLTGYTVLFEVKKYPLEKVEAIVSKDITTTSDEATVGQITNPAGGQLIVRLLKEDTSFPIGKYFLVIHLIGGETSDDNIISSNCCQTAIFKICKQ